VAGDVRRLQFPDRSFDLILCAEVLEHVPNPEIAAREISRVAAGRVVVGVPYRQDTRVGRVTCQSCGTISPPWGHINSFDERRLEAMFSGLKLERIEFIGPMHSTVTSDLATWLMDRGGNPWGTYDQQEPCACGASYYAPEQRSIAQKSFSAIAHRMNRVQGIFAAPRANWIHALFSA
jgi:SAM-dependent methyltransferase